MKVFWSVRGVFTTRKIVLMGLLVALTAVFAMFLEIYLTPQQRLFSFSYLPGALASMLFGPWAGLFVGFGGDFLGWLIKPGKGVYFPGFALSAMLQNLIYAVFFYRRSSVPDKPVKALLRALLAQTAVLIIINLGLNMMWLNVMYGRTAGEMYSLFNVALKLAQFPIDIGLLTGLCYLRRRIPQL